MKETDASHLEARVNDWGEGIHMEGDVGSVEEAASSSGRAVQ